MELMAQRWGFSLPRFPPAFPPGISTLISDGSGGSMMRLVSDTSGGPGNLRALPPISTPAIHPQEPARRVENLGAALSLIERVFGLNVTQLGEICGGVTRKAVYDWQAGAVPRPAKIERIYALRRAALDWERAGFEAPGTRLRAPVLGDRSLFDLLRAEPLDLEAIHFAGSRLNLERESVSTADLADPFR
jgi:hypothetical protein